MAKLTVFIYIVLSILALSYGWFFYEASKDYSSIPLGVVVLFSIVSAVLISVFTLTIRGSSRLNVFFVKVFEVSFIFTVLPGISSFIKLISVGDPDRSGAVLYIVFGMCTIPSIILGRMSPQTNNTPTE
jgi:hypothetical protein